MDSFGTDLNLLTYPQLQNFLRIEFGRARRYGYPLSCIAAQIDRLDHLRDLYGSRAKAEILNRVIQLFHAQSRVSDAVGLSGDRIIVLLPHTDDHGAKIIAQRAFDKLREFAFEVKGRELHLTVSIGVASSTDADSIFYDAILKQADEALARVSNAGGNGIESLQNPIDEGNPVRPLS